MNDTELLKYFDREVRQAKGIVAPDYRQETTGGVSRTIGPFPSAAHNWIDHCELGLAELPAGIEAQIQYHQSIGHAFRWKVYGYDQPAELATMLRERGFKPWEEEVALMILDLTDHEVWYPAGFEYQRLSDPPSLSQELKPIAEQVWTEGAEDLITALASEMAACGDHVGIYAAKQDGRTVGCGVLRFGERMTFGGLFAGSTMPSARGRGVYRGMVSCRAEAARELGAEFLYTEAGAMSRPILERLGFRPVSTIINYVWE